MSELSKEILQEEFSHINGITYLDHAGTTLYSSKQLEAHMKDLTSNLYSNPHSSSPSSSLTTASIDSTRELVLSHFNTNSDHYEVIFTSGCTGALNLLSQAFPWQGVSNVYSDHSSDVVVKPSLFCYLDDNHTSVVGMREVARQNGAVTRCIATSDIKVNTCRKVEPHPPPVCPIEPHPPPQAGPYHLFAYPAQSNFSGYKYPLSWSKDIAEGELVISCCEEYGDWKVVLDVASYVSTSPLDLSTHQPHFLTLSFYKIFGFPTGLGCLLVRRDCSGILAKSYYGGGTVKATDSWSSFHVAKDQLHDRFEDGTMPFLEILSLRHGFAALNRLGRSMESIQLHTFTLAKMVYCSMSELRHGNGAKACVIYSHTQFNNSCTQGPVVNFNLLAPDGQIIGYSEVEKMASVFDVHLRTGCFCNTGACMKWLALDSEKLKYNLEHGHVCGDSLDLIDGVPTGSVRISFGYMSTLEDVRRFMEFITHCFVEGSPTSNLEWEPDELGPASPGKVVCAKKDKIDGCGSYTPLLSCGDPLKVTSQKDVFEFQEEMSSPSSLYLHSITLYPIKSCAGFKVQRWPVGNKGLLLDREWMIIGESGSLLSQKQVPHLCLVHPSIDLNTCTLTLTAKGHRSISLCIGNLTTHSTINSSFLTRVCGDRVHGIDCGDNAAEWLTCVLGRKCRLVRQNPCYNRKLKQSSASSGKSFPLISLANEAQYLMLSLSSLEKLLGEIQHQLGKEEWTGVGISQLATRFRANLVVGGEGLEPYAEERWTEVMVNGKLCLQVVGKCTRCQVVCIDPETGRRSPEPLKTLLTLRGNKASFGMYLCQ